MEGLHLLALQPAGVKPPLVRQKMLQLLHWHGPVIVVALGVLAAHIPQQLLVVMVLHTLHDNRGPHQPRHVDDGFQDADSLLLILCAHLQETHVDLQHVHRQVFEGVQGRIAAAEVVHHHRKTGLPQPPDRVVNLDALLRVGALGDLALDVFHRDVVGGGQLGQVGGHVDGQDVDTGDVDGDGHRAVAPVHPAAQPLDHLHPHHLVQRRHSPVFLQHRDEPSRRDDLPLMNPAHQGLRPHDLARGDVALGLSIKGKFVVVQAHPDLREELPLLRQRILHTGLVDTDAVGEIPDGMGEGHGRPVIHRLQRHVQAVDLVDAKGGEEFGQLVPLGRPRRDLGPQRIDQLHPQGHDNAKVIPAEVPGHAAIGPLALPETAGNVDQQLVAGLPAVKLVNNAEVLHVHRNHAVSAGLRIPQEFPRRKHKAAYVVQIRQRVLFCELLVSHSSTSRSNGGSCEILYYFFR